MTRRIYSEANELRDCMMAAHDMARTVLDEMGMAGYGVVERFNEAGERTLLVPFANLITDTGDMYYATKAVQGVLPATGAAPTLATGMQIGSGTTAVAKNGAGGAMVTLLIGIAQFDATYPSVSNLGAGLGVNAVYKTTFPAGSGTGTVQEATITNGTATTASTAGNTISRVLTGAITKAAGDSLAITWNHKFLGA